MEQIPFFQHDLGDAEVESVAAALRGLILTTGDTVVEFEARLATYLGLPHAVGLTSCTAALHLALTGLGVGPGDEVITTPMTFIATATAILQAGARPVFADVEADTGNLDPALVEAAITPRTKAIVPVHLFGQMCDMRALRAIADRHGLVLVEDAAHCLEGEREGLRPGALSDAACFSFYATKSITSGEGGALATRDAALAERVRLLRQQGLSSGAAERARFGYRHRDMVTMGWKYNMYNLQAALLLPQMQRLEANHARRAALAKRYRELLAGWPHVLLPQTRPHTRHAWHIFAAWFDACDRDEVVEALQNEAVGVTVHYHPPVHLMSYFRGILGYEPGSFPIAERIGSSTISLPLYSAMPTIHVDEVVARLARVLPSGARRPLGAVAAR